MGSTTATKRNGRPKRRTPIGEIDPDKLYTRDRCYSACGLGAGALSAAVQSGMVKPYAANNRIYYLGRELIEWIVNGAPDSEVV